MALSFEPGGAVSEESKQVVLRHIEALNSGDLDAAEALTHRDFFNHEAVPSRANGPGGLRATFANLRSAFAGFRFEPLDVIAEGDKVVVRARVSGRHVGAFGGIEPTGREFSVQHIHIYRLVEGQIVEHWATRDDVAAMRQLGVLPQLVATGSSSR
jgi:steroid delta-isomerase-like uncharacterized protein